ncbi:DUF6745 domain-containing protein [Occallatibacter riparius]|uniref:DUF6745 domain-containing protein n=1 Tax=Occallatibacter riparius TaxID=1002689 RepID=A0A9J7BUF3_9BACT|nr:hypothetical protein [Occallatibacter riparius]UWZ84629.1 hypothetical protein MOP44_01540 [Occallatibacter riparius]
MTRRITKLTEAQRARFDEWADKWIEVGLRTGNADRFKFEAAVRECYRFAGLQPPKVIVWAPSPLVVAIAGPAASYLLALRERQGQRDAVHGAVHGAVGGAVGGAVHGAVGGAVDGAVRDAVLQTIANSWYYILGGQFWVSGGWWGCAFTSYFRDVCGLELEGDLWNRGRAYEATAESACWWWPHRDFVIVSERPLEIHRELADPPRPRGWGSHRLHREDGLAISFRDGWGVWSWHGTRVTRQIIEAPETLTVAQIAAEENAEVRRVMVERMGWERFCSEAKMKIIHVDELHSKFPDIPVSETVEAGTRFVTHYRPGTERAELLEAAELRDFEDRPLRFVRLTDPSTGRQYTIRVRHDHKRCYEAVAWTFGLDDEQAYKRGRFLRQGDVFLKPLLGGPLAQQHS